MASLEQQRLQLIEDFGYICYNYGEFDNAETYKEMWDHIWSSKMTKASLIDVMKGIIRTSFLHGVTSNMGDDIKLPVDTDKRLQQIKRRWKID